jgi:hypothetical protein
MIELKKDGTEYLALVEFANGKKEWVVMSWGEPCGLSNASGTPGWISGMFKLRNPEFLEVYPLQEILSKLRGESNE